jgi:hypothetical protein
LIGGLLLRQISLGGRHLRFGLPNAPLRVYFRLGVAEGS